MEISPTCSYHWQHSVAWEKWRGFRNGLPLPWLAGQTMLLYSHTLTCTWPQLFLKVSLCIITRSIRGHHHHFITALCIYMYTIKQNGIGSKCIHECECISILQIQYYRSNPQCLFNDPCILLLGTNLTVTNSCISLPVRIFSIGHCTANFSYNNTKCVQGRSVLSTLSLAHFSVMIE